MPREASPERRSPGGRAAAWGLVAPLVLAAGVSFAASLVPAGLWRAWLDTRAMDGRADSFDSETAARFLLSARWVGALLLLLGLALARHRERLLDAALATARATRAFLGGEAARLARALRAEEGAHLLALATIFAAGVALRLLHLAGPMRCDEAFSFLNYVSQPLLLAIANYAEPNNHLLNTVLAHFSVGLFGAEPWAIRLPVLVAGVAAIPASYLAVRLHFDRVAALLAAALVAAAPELVKYSVNARGYAFVVLAFLLLLGLASRLRDEPSLGAWTLFVLATALGFFALPTMLYAYAVVFLWLGAETLLARRGEARARLLRQLLLASLAAGALALLLHLPALVASGPAAFVANRWVVPLEPEAFLQALPRRAFGVWSQWNRALPGWLTPLLALGCVLAAILPSRAGRSRMGLATAVLGGCLPLVALQRVDPYVRTWLFLLPVYFALAAAGLVLAARRMPAPRLLRRLPLAATAALALCAMLGVNTLRGAEVWRSEESGAAIDGEAITRFLARELRPGDAVVAAGILPPTLRFYFARLGLDPAPLARAPRDAGRVLLVAGEPLGAEAALAAVLDVEIPREIFASPALLARFQRYHPARVYALERAPATSTLGVPGDHESHWGSGATRSSSCSPCGSPSSTSAPRALPSRLAHCSSCSPPGRPAPSSSKSGSSSTASRR